MTTIKMNNDRKEVPCPFKVIFMKYSDGTIEYNNVGAGPCQRCEYLVSLNTTDRIVKCSHPSIEPPLPAEDIISKWGK